MTERYRQRNNKVGTDEKMHILDLPLFCRLCEFIFQVSVSSSPPHLITETSYLEVTEPLFPVNSLKITLITHFNRRGNVTCI